MQHSLSTQHRIWLFGWSLLILTALALASGRWVSTVAAQTVPTVTPVPPPHQPSEPQPPSDSTPVEPAATPTDSGATSEATLPASVSSVTPPGPGGRLPTVAGRLTAAVTGLPVTGFSLPQDAGIGTVTFRNPADGAPISVVSGGLAARARWQRLTEGLRVGPPTSGKTYFSRGYAVCLWLPAGAAGFKEVRVGYFDPSPQVSRWVLLPTALFKDQACVARFRQPATFVLFGR